MMENLVGKLVKLRAVQDEDYEYISSLKNDLRTQGWSQRLPPCVTPKKVKEGFEKILKRSNAGIFAIETKEDGRMIGYMNYEEDTPRLGATLGIVIGFEYWGKGYAYEAQELLLRFLYEERGLQVVRLWTQSGNMRAVNAAKKVGFKISARMRESNIIKGEVFDTLFMDMLREEYYESRGIEDKIMGSRLTEKDAIELGRKVNRSLGKRYLGN